ncbi:MAG: DUF4345 family protein [Pseudomonadota bacterium]
MFRVFVFFVGAVFFVYGLAFAIAPDTVFEWVTHSSLPIGPALIDARATYGGMSVAIGIVMIVLARSEDTLKLGLVTVAIVNVCMATARTAGITLDGHANTMMYIYLALEIVAVLIALLGLQQLNKRPAS